VEEKWFNMHCIFCYSINMIEKEKNAVRLITDDEVEKKEIRG